MSETRIRWLAPVLVAAVCLGPARSAETDVTLRGHIDEEYSERVKTSSSTYLVGVMLGDPPENVRIPSLGGVLPRGLDGRWLCFSATTSDGVYWAHGRLQIPPGASGYVSVRAEGFSQYGTQLASYPAAEFISVFALSDDCSNTARSVFLPGSFGQARRDVLRVAINNTGQRPSAYIEYGPERKVAGACTEVEGRRRAFDRVCRFELDASAKGDVKVVIHSRPRTGPPRRDEYIVRLGE